MVGGLMVAALGGVAMVPEPEPPAPAVVEAAPTASVEEVVVVLHTGREITGFLISETDEHVVIRISEIDTTFPRNRVAAVRRLAPVPERFAALRASVDDSDVRARLALVEWLRVRQAYDLALQELEGILQVEPGNPDARTLHQWMVAHLNLAERSVKRAERSQRPAVRESIPSLPVLSERDINRIRVFEIDLKTPTRLLISDETIRRLMVTYPASFPVDLTSREQMLKMEPMDKLRLIFQLRARELYDEVRVMQDPPVMADFKSKVHSAGGWLVNACASNRCHGGTEAGRLRLVNERPNSDAAAYTNFVIIERFRLADGTPLINFEEPARSPLLQMALPRRSSLYPHPEVDPQSLGQDWSFVFRSPSERKFRDAIDWIGSLYQPRPDYGIEYPPLEPKPEGQVAPDSTDKVPPEPASGPTAPPVQVDPTKP
jgi:hypothetical protein